MADETQLLQMIGRIYEAAADPDALGHLAPDIARDFETHSAFLYIVLKPQEKSTDLLLSATANFDDKAHASYTGYYRPRNVFSNSVVENKAPLATRVLQGEEMVDRSTLLRSEIYADYFRNLGIFHALAGLFPVNGDALGIVAINRPRPAEDFSEQDRKRLNILVPHFQRAVQIQQRLSAAEQARALTVEVLERLALGIIVVDAEARIGFANAIARRVLQAGQGLTVQRGCLRPQAPAQAGKLEKVLRDAALTSIGKCLSPGGLVAVARPEKAPLSLLVSPYRTPAGAAEAGQPAALVMFSDPEAQAEVPVGVLTRMFGLASAEARLLSALVAGDTMADYADSVGVTINTAKTQLRQIFFKTGYNRQADLIRAVLSDPLMKLVGAHDGGGGVTAQLPR